MTIGLAAITGTPEGAARVLGGHLLLLEVDTNQTHEGSPWLVVAIHFSRRCKRGNASP